MDLFMVLQLLCGLALFLFGMNSMGDGLESLSGGKLEKTLEKMTNSTMKGFILGAAVTAVIQSSSATTVMVVGFVNSGIMKLRQARIPNTGLLKSVRKPVNVGSSESGSTAALI